MRTRQILPATMLVVALLGAQCAFAQTLYKLIDKDGKVTYSGEKPKNFDGQVIPMTIDPNANTATLPKGNFGPPTDGIQRAAPKAAAPTKQAQIDQAKDQLEKAKAALQSAKDNPAESDTVILGNKGGGVRMVPTDEYQQRIQQLEDAVKAAEDNLARLEKS